MTPKMKPAKKNRNNDGAFFIFHAPDMDEVYLELSSHPQWGEVETLLNDKRYTVKDTDASYRSINHWTEEGLLDDARSEGTGWRKLSFKELIWLRVLHDLRQFGLSLEKLRETFKTLRPARSIEFETGLALCFQKPSTPVFVIVFDDGAAEIATLRSLRVTDYMIGYDLPYIRINLNTLCCQVLGSSRLMPPRSPPTELLDEEREVFKLLREGGVDEVRLHLRGGTVSEIESVKKHEGAQRIADLMQDIRYGEVKVMVENGKPVHATAIKKKRIKK